MVHRKSSEPHDVIRPVTDRAPLAVAITISGKDRGGRPFVENTRTVEISGRGARISTAHELLLGSEISIENALGQTAAAKVLWRSETGLGRGFNEFGIVLLSSSSAEGLWRDLPSSGQPENAPARKDPLSLDWLDEKQTANTTPTPNTRKEGSSATLAEAPSDSAPSAAVKPSPTPPGEEVSVALQSQPLEPASQVSEAAVALTEPSTQASPGSRETRAPFPAVDFDSALKSIDFATVEGLARLQAARGTVESELTARIEGYEQRLSGLASRAIAVVEAESKTLTENLRERALSLGLEMLERSSGELLKQKASIVQTAGQELLTLTTGLIDETSSRISRTAQAAAESLADESKRVFESQSQAMEALAEQSENASRTAVDATASLAATRQQTEAALKARVAEVSGALKFIDSSTAEAESRLRAEQEAIEASLTAKVEEAERRLSGLASHAIAVVEERSGPLGDSLRERLEMLERSSGELLKQKASTVQTAGEELLTLTAGLIDDASSRISRTAQAAEESLAQESKRVLESQGQALAAFKEQAETASRTAADATASLATTRQMEAALEAKVAEASAALRSIDLSAAEVESRLRTTQGAMESSLRAKIEDTERSLIGLASRAVTTIEEKSGILGESLRQRLEILERSSGDLLKQKADIVQAAGDELLALTAGLIDETSSQISRAAQAAAASLADESKRVSEFQTEAIEALREQAQTASRTAIVTTASLAATRQQTEAALEAKVAEASAALKSIDSSASEIVSRLRATQEAIESSLTAKVEEAERRLSGLASSTIAVIEERSGPLTNNLRERLETLERSSSELLKQKANTVQTAGEELLALTAGLIDDANSRISQTAQAAVESLAQESKRVSESQAQALAALKEQAETASKTAADATASLAATRQMETALTVKVEEAERRLSGIASSAIAAIEEKSGTLGESLRERGLSLGLEMVERSSGELLKQKASIVQATTEELSTLTTGLVDEANGQVERAAQAAAGSLAQESKRIFESQTQAIEALKEQAETASRTAADASASLAATREVQAALEAKVAEATAALKSIDSSGAEVESRLRTAQEAMESSLRAKIEETERCLNGLASRTIAVIEEKSGTLGESLRERGLSLGLKMLERSAGELLRQKAGIVQTAREDLSTLTAGLIDKASGQVEQAAQAASESLAQESRRISESQAQAISAVKEQAEAASRAAVDATASLAATRQQTEAALGAKIAEVSTALKSIDFSAAEAASRLRAAQEAMESSLTAKVDEAERSLTGLASSAIAVIEEKSDALGESLQERALSVGLEMLERSSAELLKQKADVVQTAGEEVSTLAAGLIEKARGHLERTVQATAESLAQESKRVSESQGHQFLRELKAQRLDVVRDAGDDLRSLKGEIEEETANQLIQVAEGALASLGRDSQRMLEEHKSRVAQILAEQTQALAATAEAAISSLDSTQEKLATALRSRIAENERRLADQLNAVMEILARNQEALLKSSNDRTERELSLLREQATQAAQEQMRGNADRVLQDCAQQLQQQTDEATHTVTVGLAASRAEVTEQVRKELSDLTRAALASLTEEIRALAKEQGDDLRRWPGPIGEPSSEASEDAQPQWQAQQSVPTRKEADRPPLGSQNLSSQIHSAPAIGVRTFVQRLRLPIAVVGIVAVLALIVLSVRPVRRLKTAPPDAFFDEYYRAAEGGSLHAAEQKLALAYWECALQQLQSRYSGSADLPESPPPEFKVDVKRLALGRFKEDGDTRLGYWQRLRAVWTSPDTWNKSYEWNTDWIRRLLSSHTANPSH